MAHLAAGLAKSVVEGTLSKAHAAVQEEAKLRLSARRDLVFITEELEMMRSFLNVANAERVENPVVRTWVRQIRDLAYDVEDCIEFVVHLDKERTSFWFRLRRLCVPWARPSRPPALDQAVDEIEQLKARVADVSARNARYSLISDTGSKPVAQQQLTAAGDTVAASNMLAEARYAATREQVLGGDLTQLITKQGGLELHVVSVWGSAGDHGAASIITTAYSNPEICRNFTHRAWVKLVHPFTPHGFVRSLMIQFCTEEEQEEGTEIGMDVLKMMQATQEDLLKDFKKIVTEKRYLIVLEGLSNMADWHALGKFLPDRRKGSWIIVSTQQPEVASLCIGRPYQILELMKFSHEHSVCVLFKKGSHGDDNKGKKSMVEGSSLIGRESVMNELRQYPAKARINSRQVMSVWGIAGVGKSALIKKLYDDAMSDMKVFTKYCWVDISHPFNLRDFQRSLPSDFHIAESGWLIVIDNIQSKKEWDLILTSLALPRSSKSVVIAITTEESIASYCANSKEFVFNVKGLQAAAASTLFQQVYMKQSSDTRALEHTQVEELILKCGGLPKVIVVIAGILAKQTVARMDTVVSLNRRFVHHLETEPDYDSLHDLFGWMHSYFRSCPDSIKPCIFYLSIFPRDRLIRRRRLIRRWVGEGYSRDGDNESAEENGERQFSELLDLSIIQQVPHLVTNASNDTKLALLCQVNGFFHEYIIPGRKEENLMFELGANCALTTQRTGRHLIILHDWKRDKIVFESMDFSRLRSLTVFGKWKSFFISESMRLLRVLDLEDASGVEYEDLENILKWLRRLKFISLRGRHEIHHLPDNMDHLRQLQTLDVRGTSILTLPDSITKLQKLQYIRAGFTVPAASAPPDPSSWFCRPRRIVGVQVPRGIAKLTALHTLGVVNIAASGGKAMVKDLKKLTQLRKLGVSGVNRKNSKDFFSAVEGYAHLESLSARVDNDKRGCCLDDQISFLWRNLQSLKLYGLQNKLPILSLSKEENDRRTEETKQLTKLRKLDLEMDTLSPSDIELLADLPKLSILRLRVKQPCLHFYSELHGRELSTYEKVKILELGYSSSSLTVKFGSQTMKNLELLMLDCSSGTSFYLNGLDFLSELKEVLLVGTNDEVFKTDLESKLLNNPKKPVVKHVELARSC
ncbi:Disease resistance RPP13-like protein 4 [Hordeum vulgare]|nr:Disease resistance RPP13-like protein 4 [Hordeum vulgare]